MLIRTFGLFWRREHIEWGAGRRRGHLQGFYQYGKREGNTDFAGQRGVYCLYDDNFRLVYVGQAGRGDDCLMNRLRRHRDNRLAERWSRFSWFGTRGVKWDEDSSAYVLADDEVFKPELADVLDHIEGILIEAAEPVLNRQGSKFGADVYHYKQIKKLKA